MRLRGLLDGPGTVGGHQLGQGGVLAVTAGGPAAPPHGQLHVHLLAGQPRPSPSFGLTLGGHARGGLRRRDAVGGSPVLGQQLGQLGVLDGLRRRLTERTDRPPSTGHPAAGAVDPTGRHVLATERADIAAATAELAAVAVGGADGARAALQPRYGAPPGR